ncbi:hypothetical protein NZD89_18465 [Alicyclobacillus fastidiosus]|uniref:Uncharacterized protein n=1 Tax=Alicyclobacillus fastidiosus TaxID=392011 RepID=A0ABY6ZDL2_9BACL|nr:hypothetical protein [Alicyclobacillus fastidiosus]WAH40341.1 hypothetical protein NZD89_18465 [Alicyclobacillus fastidiosus]GMA61725.1 hypothetical protein GCM10025859_21650 [Alicyclobacillus fastidiosus]
MAKQEISSKTQQQLLRQVVERKMLEKSRRAEKVEPSPGHRKWMEYAAK